MITSSERIIRILCGTMIFLFGILLWIAAIYQPTMWQLWILGFVSMLFASTIWPRNHQEERQ